MHSRHGLLSQRQRNRTRRILARRRPRRKYLPALRGSKNPKVLFGDFGSSEYQYCAKAVDNGEGLIGDVGYIWEMDYRCCKLGTNPPIPESMRQILNLDLHLQGVNSGQQFLGSIEGLAAERMAFLQNLPGFSIPKPQAYDVPRLWRSPVITGKHSEILNQLPQQPDGEPG